jgi:hypothetical protein
MTQTISKAWQPIDYAVAAPEANDRKTYERLRKKFEEGSDQ